MATIEKRTDAKGKLTYRVKVRLKGYLQESATFSRRTDAKHWANNTEAAMREGRYFTTTESKKRTLTDAIERYRSELLTELKDPNHRDHHLKWWKAEIGHMLLADLRPAVISERREILKKTPSDLFSKLKPRVNSSGKGMGMD
jgi:hypothetical protein